MLEPSGFKETLLAETCHLNTICNQTLEPVKPSKITQVLVWLTAKSKEFDFEIICKFIQQEFLCCTKL